MVNINTSYKAGDVLLISFNPTLGHEQRGFRPAIVMTPNIFNQNTQTIWAIPITSTKSPRFASVTLPTIILDPPLKFIKFRKIKGQALIGQMKTLDLQARKHLLIGTLPREIYNNIAQHARLLITTYNN